MYNGKKVWNLRFDNGITLGKSNLAGNTLSLRRILSNEKQLRFGRCVPASMVFSIINNEVSLLNEGFLANLEVFQKGNNEISENANLGKFYIASEKLSSDRKKRAIEAYDALYGVLNADVAEWYESLPFPITMSAMLESFLVKFGIQQADGNRLINGNVTVDKTIESESISGKKVLESICELNGCFGIMDGNGKFKIVYLGKNNITLYLHDYTKETHEDFTTANIGRLQIRQEENDIGVIVGTGDNTYVIQDNFLVYGKTTEELTPIANTILDEIKTLSYTPCSIKAFADVNVNIGSTVNVVSKYGNYTSYILEQNFTGINSTKAEYSAVGMERLSTKQNGIQDSLLQLKGKSNVLERSIEQTRSTISDLEQGLQSQITQNANSISAEITRASGVEEQLSNRITATADSFTVKIEDLQREIDGDIKVYNTDYVPTLLNYPAWDFTYNIPCNDTVACTDVPMLYTDEYYSRNARSTVYNEVNMVTYKFSKGENGEWYWREVADSDFATVMQKVSELEITTDSIRTTVAQNQTYNNQQISSLQSSVKQTADSITAEVTRATQEEGKLSTRITQTADSITSEVSRATQAEGNLSSRISQNADAINLRVQKGSIISEINQTAETVTIKANKIDLVGVVNATEFTSKYATISSLNSEIANVKNLVAQKASIEQLSAVDGRITSLSAKAITTDNFSSQKINADNITSGTISTSRLDVGSIKASVLTVNNITATLNSPTQGSISIGTIRANNIYWYENITGSRFDYYKIGWVWVNDINGTNRRVLYINA